MLPNSSSLPDEIWCSIIQKLPLEDYIRCGSVCSRWLSIIRDLKQCSSKPRVPWLMQAPEDCDREYGIWRFFDMTRDRMHRIHLPELRGSIILGSSEGWLIVADERTADLRLFNPFTRAHIHLPPTSTFPPIVCVDRTSQGQVTRYHVETGRASRLEKLRPFDFVSALMTSFYSGFVVAVRHKCGMAFARAGDMAWTNLETGSYLCNFTFFEGLLYVMDIEGRVISFDLGGNDPPPPTIQVAPPWPLPLSNAKYLGMMSESEQLLLVLWPRGTIEAFSLDQKVGKWVQVETLGGDSLFVLTMNSAPSMICLPANDIPELQGNCMYFIEAGAVKVVSMEVEGIPSYPIGRTCNRKGRYHHDYVWISPVLVSLT